MLKRFYPTIPVLMLTLACGGAGGRTVIQVRGSDTLVNVAQAWAERYGQINPNVAVAVSGGGSGTGISALINGTIDIADASRSMSDDEVEQARARGHDPVEHVVGYDALAVFLNPANPIDSFTRAQLAAIYGEGGAYDKWSDLGVTVPGCAGGEIVRVSRQNNSGTYAYFRETMLGDTDYKLGSRDMNGSSEVVDLVAHTPCAIGYSGLAYATDDVKMPCIHLEEADPCVLPSIATAVDGTYPIARPLFNYTSGEPEGAVADYLNWILGTEGQCIILNMGYAPVNDVSCE